MSSTFRSLLFGLLIFLNVKVYPNTDFPAYEHFGLKMIDHSKKITLKSAGSGFRPF